MNKKWKCDCGVFIFLIDKKAPKYKCPAQSEEYLEHVIKKSDKSTHCSWISTILCAIWTNYENEWPYQTVVKLLTSVSFAFWPQFSPVLLFLQHGEPLQSLPTKQSYASIWATIVSPHQSNHGVVADWPILIPWRKSYPGCPHEEWMEKLHRTTQMCDYCITKQHKFR